jgi:hypothetical protein
MHERTFRIRNKGLRAGCFTLFSLHLQMRDSNQHLKALKSPTCQNLCPSKLLSCKADQYLSLRRARLSFHKRSQVVGLRQRLDSLVWTWDPPVDPGVVISSESYCEPSKANAVDQVTVREGLVLAPKARGRCKRSGMPIERKQLGTLHKNGLDDDTVVPQECQIGELEVVDSAVERKSGVKTNAFYSSSANSPTERQQATREANMCRTSLTTQKQHIHE